MAETWNRERLMEQSAAFQESRILITAAELDVFSLLHEHPRTSEELAAEQAWDPPRPSHPFGRACVARHPEPIKRRCLCVAREPGKSSHAKQRGIHPSHDPASGVTCGRHGPTCRRSCAQGPIPIPWETALGRKMPWRPSSVPCTWWEADWPET